MTMKAFDPPIQRQVFLIWYPGPTSLFIRRDVMVARILWLVSHCKKELPKLSQSCGLCLHNPSQSSQLQSDALITLIVGVRRQLVSHIIPVRNPIFKAILRQ